MELEIHDTYKKDEKLTINFEAVNNEDVINKGYFDEEVKKTNGHIAYIGKNYNEFKTQYNKQSVQEILIQRAVKTTIQILYYKGLFDNFQNADEVLEDFLFTTRRRSDLSEQVSDVLQSFC